MLSIELNSSLISINIVMQQFQDDLVNRDYGLLEVLAKVEVRDLHIIHWHGADGERGKGQ